MELVSLKDVKRDSRLIQTMIRLPHHIKQQAKKIAKDNEVNETDIYRTAILLFLANNSTDSREESEVMQ